LGLGFDGLRCCAGDGANGGVRVGCALRRWGMGSLQTWGFVGLLGLVAIWSVQV